MAARHQFLLFAALVFLCAPLRRATGVSGTPVSGEIRTTTWTKAGSPYRVTNTIRVPQGQLLTIEPGVDVLFDDDVPFVVEGRIHAVGMQTDSIRFLPARRNGVACASPAAIPAPWRMCVSAGGTRMATPIRSGTAEVDFL